jgi:hypothetical protein
MSTHSAIGIMEDGKITAIYCHFDGYLSHNGIILLKYYDEAKTKRLVSMGDISTLGTEIGEEKNPFNGMLSVKEEGTNYPKFCRFYGRDYGESDFESEEFATRKEFQIEMMMHGCEYTYLMLNGKWNVRPDGKKWMELDKAIVLDALMQD